MSESTEKAEEKLLASMTKSQDGKEGIEPRKTIVSRKRSSSQVKNTQNVDGTNDPATRDYEMRNNFVGRLRWPD